MRKVKPLNANGKLNSFIANKGPLKVVTSLAVASLLIAGVASALYSLGLYF